MDGLVKTKPPLVCSREQTGVSAMDTRKLDSLQYRKPLNSGGFLGDKAPQRKNSGNAKNYRESTHRFYSLNKLTQQRGRRLVAKFATSGTSGDDASKTCVVLSFSISRHPAREQTLKKDGSF